jgi:hypothetical protein
MSLYVLDTPNGLKIAAMVLENRASLVTRQSIRLQTDT